METAFRVCFVLLCTICFLITSGGAIKCFQCTSPADPGCEDLKQNDTDSKYYKECQENHGLQPFFCRKTSVLLLKYQVARVSRSCGTIINKKNESNCYKADTDFKAEISCQCFSDACNSVWQFKPTFSLTIILTTIVLYYTNI